MNDKATSGRCQVYESGLVFLRQRHGAMMSHLPAHLSCDAAVSEADLVLDGYTVSSRGRCVTRIGEEFVMRDSAYRCVRVPVDSTDPQVLGAIWADFCRPASGM